MTRQEEIDILQSLKGDTYFAQVFKPETIDAMCRNIENDFALDCGIEVFDNCQPALKARKEAKILKGQLDEKECELEDLREQKSQYVDFMLGQANKSSITEIKHNILDQVEYIIGTKETIRRKIQLGYDLTKDDKEWLAQNL